MDLERVLAASREDQATASGREPLGEMRPDPSGRPGDDNDVPRLEFHAGTLPILPAADDAASMGLAEREVT